MLSVCFAKSDTCAVQTKLYPKFITYGSVNNIVIDDQIIIQTLNNPTRLIIPFTTNFGALGCRQLSIDVSQSLNKYKKKFYINLVNYSGQNYQGLQTQLYLNTLDGKLEFHDKPVNKKFTVSEVLPLKKELWKIDRISNLKFNIDETSGEIWYSIGNEIIGKKYQSDAVKTGYNYIVLKMFYTGQIINSRDDFATECEANMELLKQVTSQTN